MHNAIIPEVDTEFMCFMNNDIEIQSHQWLRRMMSNFTQDNIGAVGCRLLFPDGSIQHDGIYFNLEASAAYVDHVNLKLRSTDPLFYHMPDRSYMTGVTAACMLTKKSTFVSLEGFDAQQFPIAFNDVDYCLKLLKDDKLIVHHTDITHIHHESISRQVDGDKGVSEGERQSFKQLINKWKPFLTTLTRYPKNDLPKEILKSWRPNR
jgi:GT2 family glycosyltransferase